MTVSALARILAAILVLAWALALPAVLARAAAEAAEDRVELVLDYAGAAALAEARGLPVPEVLRRFAAAGVTAVGVRERTLLQLYQQGRVNLVDGDALARSWSALVPALPAGLAPAVPVRPGWTYVSGNDPELGRELREAWMELHRSGWPAEPPRWVEGEGWLLVLPVPSGQARIVPLGFDGLALSQVREAGLEPVPLLAGSPVPGFRRPPVPAAWRQPQLGRRLAVLAGDPVPGFPGSTGEVGAFLRERGTEPALIEHWDQLGYLARRGARELVVAAGARGVRAYTLQPELRSSLPVEEQLDRIVTSVQERRLRVVYLHALPASLAGEHGDALTASVAFAAELAERLGRLGLRVGPVEPGPEVRVPAWTLLPELVAVAAAAGLVALAGLAEPARGGSVPPRLAGAAALVPFPAMAALAAVAPETLARQVAAFGAAVCFPLLALAAASRMAGATPVRGPARAPLLRGLLAALAGTGSALAGGLLIAALLGTNEFLMVWAFFRGVKLSFALPFALLGLALLAGRRPRAAGAGGTGRWPVLLLIAALVAVALVVRATAFRQVPDLEIALRRGLADLFVVRPRFKEFLIGVPALVVLGWLAPPRGSWLFAGLAVGSLVGLTSVVNSFAHVFTPVAVSLWRTANGLLLGLPLGALAAALAAGARAAAGRTRPAGG